MIANQRLRRLSAFVDSTDPTSVVPLRFRTTLEKCVVF